MIFRPLPMILLLLLAVLAGCGETDRRPVPPTAALPVTVAHPETEVESAKSADAMERILLEELAGLSRMGIRAAPRIGRVLEISRWSEAMLEPARAALEKIDPTGMLRIPALLQLEADGPGDSEWPGIVPDIEFKRLGAGALEPLLEVMAGPPGELRKEAIPYLVWMVRRKLITDNLTSVFAPISRDREDPQWKSALWALARVAPGRLGLIEELRQADMLWCCMPSEDQDVTALARAWPELIGLLNSLLADPDPEVRADAVRELREAKNIPESLVPALVDRLEDPEVGIRVEAALTLVRVAPETEGLALVVVEAFDTDRQDLYREARIALESLRPADPRVARALVRHLNHRDYIAIRETARALQFVNAPEIAIPALLSVFVPPENDGDLPQWDFSLNRLMEFAALSLASYGDHFPGAVTFFVKYLPCNQWVSYRRGHESRYVRGRDWAAEALGMLGPSAEPAIPALVKALDYGSLCSHEAAGALVKIGAPGVDALVNALDHPSENVRGRVASHLSKLTLPRHEAALQKALADESVLVRVYVCAALLRIRPDSQVYQAEAARLLDDEDLEEDREWLRETIPALE